MCSGFSSCSYCTTGKFKVVLDHFALLSHSLFKFGLSTDPLGPSQSRVV